LDIDHGTYPFVTSSNTLPSAASSGSGMSTKDIGYILGIVKAYTTRVGSGPFPSELSNSIGQKLGQIGNEFGTVTGRQRRCGWFDSVITRHSMEVAGIDGIALTKLDVLDSFKEIKICIGYKLYNKKMKYFLPLIIALSLLINPVNTYAEELILAGGCFWCLEHDLESLKGINFVQSGYSGGDLQNPTYENHEGHQEVVLVNYDSKLVTLPEILRLYFRNIDPLDGKGQFCDRGDSYRPVIFFKDETEETDAKNSILSASNELRVPLEKISVELKSKGKFWLAEEYHQDFAERNELKYKFYRFSCGRDQRLDKLWGDNARSLNLWTE